MTHTLHTRYTLTHLGGIVEPKPNRFNTRLVGAIILAQSFTIAPQSATLQRHHFPPR